MRTPETAATFSRDIAAIRAMEGRPPSYIADALASTRARHADYDAQFNRAIKQARTLEPRLRRVACELLKRLGGSNCMSGSLEFRWATDALERLGVPNANGVFYCDRQFIAMRYWPGDVQVETVAKFVPSIPARETETV